MRRTPTPPIDIPPLVLPAQADAKASASTYAFDAIRGHPPTPNNSIVEKANRILRAKRARGVLYALAPNPTAKPRIYGDAGRSSEFSFTISEMRAFENNRAEVLRRGAKRECIWVGLGDGGRVSEIPSQHGRSGELLPLEPCHIERFNAWLDDYLLSFGAHADRAAEVYDIKSHRLEMEEVDWTYVPPKPDELRGAQDFIVWWDEEGAAMPNLAFFEGAKLTDSEVNHLRLHERLERTLFPAGGMPLSGTGGRVPLPPLSVRIARRKTMFILGLSES